MLLLFVFSLYIYRFLCKLLSIHQFCFFTFSQCSVIFHFFYFLSYLSSYLFLYVLHLSLVSFLICVATHQISSFLSVFNVICHISRLFFLMFSLPYLFVLFFFTCVLFYSSFYSFIAPVFFIVFHLYSYCLIFICLTSYFCLYHLCYLKPFLGYVYTLSSLSTVLHSYFSSLFLFVSISSNCLLLIYVYSLFHLQFCFFIFNLHFVTFLFGLPLANIFLSLLQVLLCSPQISTYTIIHKN